MNKIKSIIKNVVTSSNFLSSIRRYYSFKIGCREYKKIEKEYNKLKYCENIENFKNKYEGKRCFIIGNGPSLVAQDLEMLKNEFCFAANRIYLMYDKTSWRPTFYMCQDHQILRAEWENINKFTNVNKFIAYNPMYKYQIQIPNSNLYLADNRDYLKRKLPIKFSDNCPKGVFDASTVTYSSIQLAMYMGFKDIYLLGVDHNYAYTINKNRKVTYDQNVKTYFDDSYKDVYKEFEKKTGSVFAVYDFEAVNSAYEQSKKHSQNNKVNIYNATRGGKLEIFERVNFDEVMKKI